MLRRILSEVEALDPASLCHFYFKDAGEIYGVPGVIRTRDPLLRRQMLYPAELQGQNSLLLLPIPLTRYRIILSSARDTCLPALRNFAEIPRTKSRKIFDFHGADRHPTKLQARFTCFLYLIVGRGAGT